MKDLPSVALVLNTFNQPDYLARVIQALRRQTRLPEELLLADDGSGEETRRVFAERTAGLGWRCEHAWQENRGFRRSRILNLAVARVAADYVIFLDGDSIPHPEFVADHARLAARDAFVQGHRALVGQKAAAFFGLGRFRADRRRAFLQGQLRGWQNAYRWPCPWKRTRRDLRGVRGCNLAIWREDLVAVNGYNEAFLGWGREDSELCVRLMNLRRRRVDVRGWALCYHLWHPPVSRAGLPANDDLLEKAKVEGARRCPRGLDQHLPGTPSPTVDPAAR